jgi:putative tryptophan/tyrosine transport system substrate-binding protein
MTSRHIIAIALVLLGTIPFVPDAADARDQGQVRIGVLSTSASSAGSRFSDILRETLRESGYVEGRNLAIEWRHAEGRVDRFDDLAADLVQLEVDVLIASVPAAAVAAKRATRSIPIVMVNTPDPVQLGIVSSLARPDGNITGTATLSVELSVKQLELLREALPRASRIAVLWNPANVWHPVALSGVTAGAATLGIELLQFPVSAPEAFGDAFKAMKERGGDAILVLADPLTFHFRREIGELASRHVLPAMYGLKEHASTGGLMSYWADSADLYRRTGAYVAKILKGSKPSDLPIEQPSKFELVVNLRSARELGIVIPPSLLARADEVIE